MLLNLYSANQPRIRENKPQIPKPIKVKIVMVWTMVLLGMVIYALAWFVFGAVAMTFIDAIDNAFTFDAPWDNVVDFVKTIVYWHPVLSLLGWLLWGYANSLKRDIDTWRV